MVSNADLGERGTCQNPELVSSLVNSWAPGSWASIDSVVDACPYAHCGLVGSSPHRFSLFHLPWEQQPCLHTMQLARSLRQGLPALPFAGFLLPQLS